MPWPRQQHKANTCPPDVFYYEASEPTTGTLSEELGREVMVIMEEDWRIPVLDYLHDILPDEPNQLHRLQQKCWNSKLVGDIMYKAGISAPLLRCVAKQEGRAILEEIHSGLGDLHASARVLVRKAFRPGFYWPTALRDAHQLISIAILVSGWPRRVASPQPRSIPSSQCGPWPCGGST